MNTIAHKPFHDAVYFIDYTNTLIEQILANNGGPEGPGDGGGVV